MSWIFSRSPVFVDLRWFNQHFDLSRYKDKHSIQHITITIYTCLYFIDRMIAIIWMFQPTFCCRNSARIVTSASASVPSAPASLVWHPWRLLHGYPWKLHVNNMSCKNQALKVPGLLLTIHFVDTIAKAGNEQNRGSACGRSSPGAAAFLGAGDQISINFPKKKTELHGMIVGYMYSNVALGDLNHTW